MMSKLLPGALLGVLLLFTACHKGADCAALKLNQGDYLLFGSFYSECSGPDCVTLYKLTSDKLYEDVHDDYYDPEPFDFVALDSTKFEIAQDLLAEFPVELLAMPDFNFGCPDCRDQGGIYIQLVQNGAAKTWRIDRDKKEIPVYLHSFVDEVDHRLRLIAE